MKHTLKITIFLFLLFLAAQVIGIFTINQYEKFPTLPFSIERPTYDEQTSYLPIIIAIFIGTILALVLAKFRAFRIWKLWFFLSVLFTLIIAFSAFMNQWIALVLAMILSIWKVFRFNVIAHNLSELFIYAGLAAVFVPVLNLWSATILLLIISIYDMWAVWKSKHMIKLAEFQKDSQVFAGINVHYKKKRTAIIGGGDIAFPLLFAGVILIKYNLISSLIVSLFASIALLLLLIYSKKDRYYPAMPFITAGCFAGFAVIKLFGL